jgi:molecular chaperone DnaJ
LPPQRDYFEKDYYATLGVAKNASATEISKAYRKLARELHPDRRPGDKDAESRFKEVSEAYSVLSNPDKRKEYDQVRDLVGSGMFHGGFGAPGGGSARTGARSTEGLFDLGDIFGGLFGDSGPLGTRRRTGAYGARRGRDIETDVTLSFEDALAGVTVTLRVEGAAACSTCGGSGAKPGTSPITCPDCGGTGQVAENQGLFSLSHPCPKCGGTGRQVLEKCPTCGGSGVQRRPRTIHARIPAGVRDGATVRLAGKGEPGTGGGPAGDLFVRVHVTPHELFVRRDDDLLITVPITFAEAALGSRITVPTLDEPVTLKIPAGTGSGQTFRVRGRGVARPDGGRGDLLVTVEVVVPRRLTKTQRKLLEDFAATDNSGVRDRFERHMASKGV